MLMLTTSVSCIPYVHREVMSVNYTVISVNSLIVVWYISVTCMVIARPSANCGWDFKLELSNIM